MLSNSKVVTGVVMFSSQSITVLQCLQDREFVFLLENDVFGPPPVPFKCLFTIAFMNLTLVRKSCQVFK